MCTFRFIEIARRVRSLQDSFFQSSLYSTPDNSSKGAVRSRPSCTVSNAPRVRVFRSTSVVLRSVIFPSKSWFPFMRSRALLLVFSRPRPVVNTVTLESHGNSVWSESKHLRECRSSTDSCPILIAACDNHVFEHLD